MASYGHRIQILDHECFRISWVIDRKISGSRLRFPTTLSRDTDKAGAERFAKKWNLVFTPSHSASEER